MVKNIEEMLKETKEGRQLLEERDILREQWMCEKEAAQKTWDKLNKVQIKIQYFNRIK